MALNKCAIAQMWVLGSAFRGSEHIHNKTSDNRRKYHLESRICRQLAARLRRYRNFLRRCVLFPKSREILNQKVTEKSDRLDVLNATLGWKYSGC